MNGTNGSAAAHDVAIAPVTVLERRKRPRFSQKRIQLLLDKLAVPFETTIIQWTVAETRKNGGTLEGRVLPYADKLAYVHRLHEVFSPVGWTDTLTVHPAIIAGPGQSGRVQQKIVVTCQLTIHGINTHSSTGEYWAGDQNAATSAEAQAFKRACALFGLGLYLSSFFGGRWVVLNRNKEVVTPPPLPDWATPAGWLAGARPNVERVPPSSLDVVPAVNPDVVREIEAMQNDFGTEVWRRILKRHLVWDPRKITDPAIATRLLADLKDAAPLMLRAAAARERIGTPAFEEVMKFLGLRCLADFGNCGALEKLVPALEAKARNLDGS
jgi:hypothetical protein